MDQLKQKQVEAKRLLVYCMQMPDGQAAGHVDSMTEDELDKVCQVGAEPQRVRRQVLKSVMDEINYARGAAAPQDPETPPAVPVDGEASAEEQPVDPTPESDSEPDDAALDPDDTEVVE